MIHLAERIRELVSKSIEMLLETAGNQQKMLRLLRSEIEEALIGLHGDRPKTQRAYERQVNAAHALEGAAEAWTAKAQTAANHGRHDLARAAVLAREGDRAKAAAMRRESEGLAEQIKQIDAAIAELEAKRVKLSERMAELPRIESKR
ncbi:MAG: hypothetical protein AAF687_01480 [Pseudomonadota bacterium]